MSPRPLIEIRNLFQAFPTAVGQETEILHDINLDLYEHEIGFPRLPELRAVPVADGPREHRARAVALDADA